MRTRHTGQVEQRNMFYPYGASRADCWSDSAMEQRWKEKQAAKRAYTPVTEEATTTE